MKTISFILLLFVSSLYAKPFSVVIHKPFTSALYDIKEDYDRTLSATGITRNFKATSNTQESYDNVFDFLASRSQSYGAQIAFVKVDNQANILINTSAKFPRFNTAVSILKTPTNGSFIGGYTMDGQLLVAKLSPQAKPLASQLFGTKNYDRLSKIIPLSDGGILAVGSSVTSRDTHDDMFQTGLGNNDIFLTRFDKNLQIRWSKKYGTLHDDVGIDAVEAQDGSIIVISTTSYEKHKDVSLMRITENGNRIWLKHYTKGVHIVPKKIIRLRDNHFVVALTQYSKNYEPHIRLIKFDLYQNIIQDKELLFAKQTQLFDIAEFSNGRFFGVGIQKNGANTDAYAVELSEDFTLLHQNHFGTRNYDAFYALALLHNSQVAIAGQHTDPNSQESNMWIVKLNSDTTMATVPNTTYTQLSGVQQALYNDLRTTFAYEIQNKQLTITPDLKITLLGKPLLFQAGEYKLTHTQKQFLQNFFPKLLRVMKRYEKDIALLECNGHTSHEWRNTNFTNRYLNNQELSMKRAFSVLHFIFLHQPKQMQQWLSTILKGSGDGYRKTGEPLLDNTQRTQRHVRFQINLKSP